MTINSPKAAQVNARLSGSGAYSSKVHDDFDISSTARRTRLPRCTGAQFQDRARSRCQGDLTIHAFEAKGPNFVLNHELCIDYCECA